MPGIPLESLVTRARTAANMQVGGPWDEAEWDAGINSAVTAFYVDCQARNPAWKVSIATLAITNTAVPYAALPADFSNLFRLTKDANTAQRCPVYQSGDERPAERTYRIEGVNLWIDPYENAVGSYELRYNPVPAILTPSVDLDPELAQHREYFELHAAIACLTTEEASTKSLMDRFIPVQLRALAWAAARRSSDAVRPRDVRPRMAVQRYR